MALKDFRLPDIGEGTAEAELVQWHVDVGDDVAEDQLLCEVMTDKASIEVTAPFSGRVVTRKGQPGEMLPVGDVVLRFALPGDEAGSAEEAPETEPSSAEAPQSSASASPLNGARREFRLPDIGEGTAEVELTSWHVNVGDVVEEDQLLCEVMTDKASVEVTAPYAGTIVERIGAAGEMLPVGSVVLIFAVGGSADGSEPAPEAERASLNSAVEPMAATQLRERQGRVLAAPAVRARAAQLSIDLSQVAVTGPEGRVTHRDLDAYIARQQPTPAAPASSSETAPAPRIPEPLEGVEDVPVIGLRRRISERMQDTKRRIPHFSYIEEIDVTKLEKLRTGMNDQRREGQPKLTILPFLIRAMSRVLPEFPQINALYDDSAGLVRRYSAMHAGIATQTPQGLVVTVLRDAETRNLWNMASEITRLSGLAREGRAGKSDLSGSTITITSLAVMGGVATTPVINSPEVAIIGVNKIAERAVVENGEVRVAKMMNLSSSFDHRVVDGWDAASFIQRLKAELEDPMFMLV